MLYKMEGATARNLLASLGINPTTAFAELRAPQINQLVEFARQTGFRKPLRNTSGASMGCHFHTYLIRRAASRRPPLESTP
jgi:hypothetical protein